MIDDNQQKQQLPLAIINFMQQFSWILVVLILIFGWSAPWLMVATFICMVGPVFFSFSFGRAWCGNFCPRGSFSKVVLSIISPDKPFPRLLKNKLLRTMVFLILMVFFTYNLFLSQGTLYGIGMAFIKMMAVTTIVQIVFAIMIHPYAWCAVCPMGTVSSFISSIRRDKIYNIKINDGCKSCGICTGKCPMKIDIPSWSATGEIKDSDCMKCGICLKSCSGKCLQY